MEKGVTASTGPSAQGEEPRTLKTVAKGATCREQTSPNQGVLCQVLAGFQNCCGAVTKGILPLFEQGVCSLALGFTTECQVLGSR